VSEEDFFFQPTMHIRVRVGLVCGRNATRSAGNEVTPKSFRDAARPLCTLRIRNSFSYDMRMSATAFYALISCHVTIREKTVSQYELLST